MLQELFECALLRADQGYAYPLILLNIHAMLCSMLHAANTVAQRSRDASLQTDKVLYLTACQASSKTSFRLRCTTSWHGVAGRLAYHYASTHVPARKLSGA